MPHPPLSRHTTDHAWDVIVIGGGPSGMLAAGRAGALGARVLLLEKNPAVGKKLLITGGGRCNLTNATFDTRTLLARYRSRSKFLFSAFARFGVEETLDFFHRRGLATKVEAEARVFPVSDSAQSVHDVLTAYLKENRVTIRTNVTVSSIEQKDGRVTGIMLRDGSRIAARAVILATGGRSRPETGSTGDGFGWLKALGHTVREADVALVPVRLGERWIKDVSGLPLPEAGLTLVADGKRVIKRTGKFLFTHTGASGPLVLNLSRDIAEYLKYGPVVLALDLFPAETKETLDQRLRNHFEAQQNRKLKNALSGFLPPRLIAPLLGLSRIDPELFVNKLDRASRLHLVTLMHYLPLTVTGLLGAEKAVVTSGGVALEEVDLRTMRSRLCDNLYIVGDLLDIDRPSGGYSLQLCWTTGWVAGTAAAGGETKKQA